MLDQIRRALASYQPRRIDRDGLPRAAVLLPLYEKDGVQHLVLQVRTDLVEHHKGQISFPGGAQDPGDVDLLHTALRETEEEIGLQREDVEVLGQLDDIITITNFLVTPYVGRITRPAPYPFAPSGYEVAELLEVPLPHLLDPASYNPEPVPWRDRLVGPPSYSYGRHVIWGATGRILQQFLALIRAHTEADTSRRQT
jgi:8-oxo-dGTP pyrophosphatase MutT (NUDIX family)